MNYTTRVQMIVPGHPLFNQEAADIAQYGPRVLLECWFADGSPRCAMTFGAHAEGWAWALDNENGAFSE